MFPKILVPLDFSDYSGRCLEYVKELIDCGCKILEIVLLHVVDDRIVKFTEEMFEDTIDDRSVVEACRQTASQKLSEMENKFVNANLKVRTMVRLGIPFSTILKVAEEVQASLIILGHRGHNLASELLGSVTEKVSRKAKVPVLLIR